MFAKNSFGGDNLLIVESFVNFPFENNPFPATEQQQINEPNL